MKVKPVLLGAAILASSLSGPAVAQQAQYVQIAELEIDPAQLESYKAAVSEHAEMAIRVEPGVLVWLLLGSGVMAARHMTRAATRAPRRALPRRRALCTNSKKPT